MPDTDAPSGAAATPPPAVRPPVAAGPAGKLTADEERQLGELMERQRVAAMAGPTMRLKVEPPHESFEFGGIKVGSEFTEVSERAGVAIMNAAVPAGVTITQES